MSQSANQAIAEAIAATKGGFLDAFARGDAAGCAAAYTEGAVILPPDRETIKGRAAIQDYWQRAVDRGQRGATLETVELQTFATEAVEVGEFTTSVDGEVVGRGKYIAVWKQEGGAWKYHRDIWNSSLPAPK